MRLTSAMPPERAAFIGLAGYLAGFFIMPHEWFHLGWLGLGAALLILRPWSLRALRLPSGLGLVGIFLGWMVLRAWLGPHLDWSRHAGEVGRGLAGAALLGILLWLISVLAQRKAALSSIGPLVVTAAVIAALLSIAGLPGLWECWVWGQRLSNPLVHGGLNPVVTGLTFAFAAAWCLHLANRSIGSGRHHRVWQVSLFALHMGTFLADSRGALLVLLVAHLVEGSSAGWWRTRGSVLNLVLAGMLWLVLGLDGTAPTDAGGNGWMERHRVAQQVHRRDTGRFALYQAALAAQSSVLTGEGLWGSRDRWQCGYGDDQNLRHLHSGFLSTYFHGGLVGLLLVLAIIRRGLLSAWQLHQRGDSLWLTLCCAGLAGGVFDGESLASLTTAPRFEGMLFWFPLLSAMALNSVDHDKAPE